MKHAYFTIKDTGVSKRFESLWINTNWIDIQPYCGTNKIN